MSLREDSNFIINKVLQAVQPNNAVKRTLQNKKFPSGKLILIAIGKAAWSMAKAASEALNNKIDSGIVITKYDHNMGAIPNIKIFEAGHPVPDSNSYMATNEVLEATGNLSPNDSVLFLISGGGSALFESPLISPDEMAEFNSQLLASGADIVEINTLRKRFSKVKAGRFAQHCYPAKVFSIVLSDIIGDPLDMIASGPAYPDSSTAQDAIRIVEKYNLKLNAQMQSLISIETPKNLDNVETVITGSVRELCLSASKASLELGYKPLILSDSLNCVAREAGSFFAAIARYYQNTSEALAIIAGGETLVNLVGKGMGGRNQELALSAALGLQGLKNTALFSLGSDGTDGPTDAAGGYVDGDTAKNLKNKDIDIYSVLANNDAYNALKACDGIIITGPTGTNVNDVAVLLIKPE